MSNIPGSGDDGMNACTYGAARYSLSLNHTISFSANTLDGVRKKDGVHKLRKRERKKEEDGRGEGKGE
jgi:hypothetical protein